MPARMILPLILGMLVLPAFPQDEPPPTTEDTSESDDIADLITKAEQASQSRCIALTIFITLLGESFTLRVVGLEES